MEIDYDQHILLEQHYSRKKAQSEPPQPVVKPSSRSLLKELDEESHFAVDADSRAAQSEWVPVIDVFSSARLSESEEALMRRVIAHRVAPTVTS